MSAYHGVCGRRDWVRQQWGIEDPYKQFLAKRRAERQQQRDAEESALLLTLAGVRRLSGNSAAKALKERLAWRLHTRRLMVRMKIL